MSYILLLLNRQEIPCCSVWQLYRDRLHDGLEKKFSVVLSFGGSIPHLDIEGEWPPSPSGKNPRKPQRAAVAWGNPKKSERAGYIYLWAGAVVSFFSLRGLAKNAQNGFCGCRGI